MGQDTRYPLPKISAHKDSYASEINDNNQIVGKTITIQYNDWGVIWNNLQPSIIDALGIYFLSTGGINDSGQIVGQYFDNIEYKIKAFRWDNGVIDPIGGNKDWTQANGINDAGQVVGSVPEGIFDYGCAYYWNGGSIIYLERPFGYKSSANAINDSLQIVGAMTDRSDVIHAYLWPDSTTAIDLNFQIPHNSGWILQSATDINNLGEIIGEGELNGSPRSFILLPIATVFGDMDGDSDVDGVDLTNFSTAYSQGLAEADLNNDGAVIPADLEILGLVLTSAKMQKNGVPVAV